MTQPRRVFDGCPPEVRSDRGPADGDLDERERESRIDEALEDTFPASDPPIFPAS